jgi:hypothetical protein
VLTVDEDARVLELLARVRGLDEEIGHMRRHPETGKSMFRDRPSNPIPADAHSKPEE